MRIYLFTEINDTELATSTGVEGANRDYYLLYGEVINKMMIVFIQVAVQGNTVTVEQQVLQSADPLQSQSTLHAIRQVRVIENHTEAKGFGTESHGLPNTPWNETNTPWEQMWCSWWV